MVSCHWFHSIATMQPMYHRVQVLLIVQQILPGETTTIADYHKVLWLIDISTQDINKTKEMSHTSPYPKHKTMKMVGDSKIVKTCTTKSACLEVWGAIRQLKIWAFLSECVSRLCRNQSVSSLMSSINKFHHNLFYALEKAIMHRHSNQVTGLPEYVICTYGKWIP